MARLPKMNSQSYPRVDGFLDDSTLVSHTTKLPAETVKALIKAAIVKASTKSSREILSIPPDADARTVEALYKKAGAKLFVYFRKYCGDPAATAHQLAGKHFREVGKDAFRNCTLQKERMNSGWRYQFLVIDAARQTHRFVNVGDIGTSAGDFNAIIKFIDESLGAINLYVSVKNRTNTMGGADWPKAIEALELAAIQDKNKTGPYCCVFGMAMDQGTRRIKNDQKTGRPHSVNTEVWLSDYFWPFFTNYSYEEIRKLFLDVLIETSATPDELPTELDVPDAVLNAFGAACQKANLLDELGNFNDPYALVTFFCGSKIH